MKDIPGLFSCHCLLIDISRMNSEIRFRGYQLSRDEWTYAPLHEDNIILVTFLLLRRHRKTIITFPHASSRISQNPENPHYFDSTKLSWILKNPLESLGIPRNPQEFPVNPQKPQESWESSGFFPDQSWKPRTKFLKCRTPRWKLCSTRGLLIFSYFKCKF